jgi:tetratricopeptide (TPR) repeat protein
MLGEGALIDRDPAADRYAMHELVRQFAAEQLAGDAEEEAALRARHAAFYAALVERAASALRPTVAPQEAISADIANIQVAWDWAAERAEAGLLERMLAGFARWHDQQGLPGQAVWALERAAARLRVGLAQAATPDPAVQRLLGFVLVQEAYDLNWLAAYDRARLLLEEAATLARAAASPQLEGWVAYGLGYQLARQRDLRGAGYWLPRALALARDARQPDLEAYTLQTLGNCAVWAGAYARARDHLERALALFRGQQQRLGEIRVSFSLGLMARVQGDFGEAQRLLEDGLQLVRAMACEHMGDWFLLHELGQVHDEGWGRHVAAAEFFAQDLRSTREAGDRTREAFALAGRGSRAPGPGVQPEPGGQLPGERRDGPAWAGPAGPLSGRRETRAPVRAGGAEGRPDGGAAPGGAAGAAPARARAARAGRGAGRTGGVPAGSGSRRGARRAAPAR